MTVAEKIRYLREVEGSLRGLDRAMSQQELVRAMRDVLREPLSAAGARTDTPGSALGAR